MHKLKPRVWLLVLLTISLHFVISFVAIGNDVFYWSLGRASIDGDVEIYFHYASRMASGEIPYREFHMEYPVGAVPLFLIPRLIADDFGNYHKAFVVEMLIFNAAIIVLLATRRREGNELPLGIQLCWYTLFFTILSPLIVGRYDLAPTAMAFAAACALSGGWCRLAGVLAAMGTLTKIFPGSIIAPSLLSELRARPWSRWKTNLAFITVGILGFVLWSLVGHWGVRDTLHVLGKRGLEVESIYAGVILLLQPFLQFPTLIIDNYGSSNIYFEYHEIFLIVIPSVQLGVVFAIAWMSHDRCESDAFRCATAALLGFLITGKVLSPQYLIWLVPFLAVLRGRAGTWIRPLFFFACFLTRILYPGIGFRGLLHNEAWAVLLLNLRNLLLCIIFGIIIHQFSRGKRSGQQVRSLSGLPTLASDGPQVHSSSNDESVSAFSPTEHDSQIAQQ